jgi:hypothetical protein
MLKIVKLSGLFEYRQPQRALRVSSSCGGRWSEDRERRWTLRDVPPLSACDIVARRGFPAVRPRGIRSDLFQVSAAASRHVSRL